MRTGIVVIGIALMIFGASLGVFAYINGWFGGIYGVILLAGPVVVAGLIAFLIGLVTGRGPKVLPMPIPSTGAGAICPRCGGGLPYVAGNIKCPYCGKKVIPVAGAPVAYPTVQGSQAVLHRPGFVQTRPRFCRFCGTPLHPSSFFCQQCGRDLTT